MPIENALIVGAIVLAFVVFAAVLAWGEHRTRHWRQSDQSAPSNKPNNVEQLPTRSKSPRELTAA
jgi:hypothetical protein